MKESEFSAHHRGGRPHVGYQKMAFLQATANEVRRAAEKRPEESGWCTKQGVPQPVRAKKCSKVANHPTSGLIGELLPEALVKTPPG